MMIRIRLWKEDLIDTLQDPAKGLELSNEEGISMFLLAVYYRFPEEGLDPHITRLLPLLAGLVLLLTDFLIGLHSRLKVIKAPC